MAADNEVEVKFSASTDALDKGISHAAESVAHAGHGMAAGLNPAQVAIVALGQALEHFTEHILEELKEAVHEAVHAYAELGAEIEHLQHRIGGSAEDLSELKVALDSVGLSTGTFESIARRLPQILETHKEKFKAAGVAYKDAEGNLLPVSEVILNLNEHLEKFTSGSARNTEGVKLMGRAFYQMADVVELTKERMGEATAVAGEFGLTLTEKDLEATNEFERKTKLLHIALHGFYVEVGKYVNPIMTELADLFRNTLSPVFIVFKTVCIETAAVIKSVWSVIAVIFNAVGDAITGVFSADSEPMTAMKFFAGMCKFVAKLAIELSAYAQSAFEGIRGSIDICVESIKLFGKIWADVFDKRRWGQIGDDWEAGMKRIEGAVLKSAAKLADIDATKHLKFEEIDNPTKPHREEEEHPKAPPDKIGSGTFAQIAAEAQRKLALRKQDLKEAEELNDWQHRHDLETEKDFWTQKIALVQAGIDAEIAKLKSDLGSAHKETAQADDGDSKRAGLAKEYALETQIKVLEAQRRDAFVQGEKDMQDAIDKRVVAQTLVELTRQKQFEEDRIAIKKNAIKQMEDLQAIDYETAAAQNAAAEQEEYENTRKYLEAKFDLERKITSDITKLKLDADSAMEAAYLSHQQRLTAIAGAAELKRKSYSLQAQREVQGAFSRMVFDLTDGVKKLSNIFKDFALSVIHAFQNIIAQRFADKMFGSGSSMGKMMDKFVDTVIGGLDKVLAVVLGNEEAQTTAKIIGAETRGAVETGAAGQSMLISGATAIKNILNSAWEAMAGAFKAIAGIPFVGPFLAPAIAAGAFAAVAGMVSGISSSEGGAWMIPGDRLNMVHAQETILPADKSKKLDAMLESGRGAGGVTVNITAMDSQDVRRALQRGGALQKEMKHLMRNFAQIKPA